MKKDMMGEYSESAITSFVLSLVGILFFLLILLFNNYLSISHPPLPLILLGHLAFWSVLFSIIFGIISLVKIKKNKNLKGKKHAIMGVIISSILLIIFIIFLTIYG